MKYILLLIAAWAILPACNNNNETATTVTPETVKPEEALRQAIAQYPDSVALRDRLAGIFISNEAYYEALAVADAGIKRDSSNAHFWDMKGELYSMMEDTTNAIKAMETAIELKPKPEYLQVLGYLYAESKNEKALMIGDALIIADKAKSQKEALLIKGIYYNRIGEKNKAIAEFNLALGLDYTFMFAYREKAITLYDMGRYAEALEVTQKATTLQNSFDEGYYWMGRCYEKLNKIPEAIESYQTALAYSKGNYLEAADALARLGVK